MNNKLDTDRKDVDLFRQTIGDVVAIKQDKVALSKPPSPRHPKSINSGNKSTSHYFDEFIPEEFRVTASDHIEFKRPGIQDRVFRKLRRGQLPIQATLDLHGMTIYNAKLALDKFRAQLSQFNNQSCVRIIHGKGLGSRDGLPKIKQFLQQWLQEDKKVLAYSSCVQSDGGTGAIYLLYKAGQNLDNSA